MISSKSLLLFFNHWFQLLRKSSLFLAIKILSLIPNTCSVTKSRLTLGDHMDYSPPYSSTTIAHYSSFFLEFTKQEYWSGLPFPSPTQGSKPCLMHWQWILYHWATREVVYQFYTIHKLKTLMSLRWSVLPLVSQRVNAIIIKTEVFWGIP